MFVVLVEYFSRRFGALYVVPWNVDCCRGAVIKNASFR